MISSEIKWILAGRDGYFIHETFICKSIRRRIYASPPHNGNGCLKRYIRKTNVFDAIEIWFYKTFGDAIIRHIDFTTTHMADVLTSHANFICSHVSVLYRGLASVTHAGTERSLRGIVLTRPNHLDRGSQFLRDHCRFMRIIHESFSAKPT